MNPAYSASRPMYPVPPQPLNNYNGLKQAQDKSYSGYGPPPPTNNNNNNNGPGYYQQGPKPPIEQLSQMSISQNSLPSSQSGGLNGPYANKVPYSSNQGPPPNYPAPPSSESIPSQSFSGAPLTGSHPELSVNGHHGMGDTQRYKPSNNFPPQGPTPNSQGLPPQGPTPIPQGLPPQGPTPIPQGIPPQSLPQGSLRHANPQRMPPPPSQGSQYQKPPVSQGFSQQQAPAPGFPQQILPPPLPQGQHNAPQSQRGYSDLNQQSPLPQSNFPPPNSAYSQFQQGPAPTPPSPGFQSQNSYASQFPQSAPSQGNSNFQNRYPSQQPPLPGAPQQTPQYQPPPYQGAYPSNQYQGGNAVSHRPSIDQMRRLDPDQMPSPIQVIEDDKKQKSGDFCTGSKGLVPPLVTTEFVAIDEGISNPRFIRSSIYNVPCTSDIHKQAYVPFSVTVSPFAKLHEKELAPPLSDLGELGPVRCNRCKTYMCPFMQFIDGGRRFQCVFCKGTTDVPPEYFHHLDPTGRRADAYNRPELCLGSYEYLATKEYCKGEVLPNPPAYIFMVDVSYNSIRNGMVKLLCDNLREIIRTIPRENLVEKSALRVGFVTYSSVVHFYNINSGLAQPHMLVVSDVGDMFVPLVEGFLVPLEQAESALDSLLEQIPLMFGEARETETILGPVIQAGYEALKAANCSGKLFIFHTTLPLADAPGKLKNRDDRKLLGTDKEKNILIPQNQFYNNLGKECVKVGCSVDLFLFPNAYVDVATLGQICRITGGHIYKYNYFEAENDGEEFLNDLRMDVHKEIGFDAVMKVRTSTGIRPTAFYGNYYTENTTDVELCAVDGDKAITIEIKYDDKLNEEEGAFIQAAVLYTSISGQRRLRIHNLALATCSQLAELFRTCELDATVNLLAKESVASLVDVGARQVKEKLVSRSAQMLAAYRKHCANPTSAGQLILPECMKLLPLYINCLIKSDALSGGSEITTDDRSYSMYSVSSMDVESSVVYLYPRLLPLHDLDLSNAEIPVGIRCTSEKLEENGAYLLENGQVMFLYLAPLLSSEWINQVFGVQSLSMVNLEKTFVPELNNPLSRRVCGIIQQIRKQRHHHMKLFLARQGDKRDLMFRHLLVEDRAGEGTVSYVDFLCHLHKEIRTLLS